MAQILQGQQNVRLSYSPCAKCERHPHYPELLPMTLHKGDVCLICGVTSGTQLGSYSFSSSSSAESRLETLPSLGETIVLHIINVSQPVTGYQIRKQFIQTTNRRLSFGTLVPMLQRLEESQFVLRVPKRPAEPVSYNWFLTPDGIEELESRLALMAKMLDLSRRRQDDGFYTLAGIGESR
jgi:DNA-binding PadR family transcriptional regulator